MKKLFITTLTIIIAFTLILTTSAQGNIYAFDGITIKFSENSALSPETQAAVAEMIVNHEEISSVTTYNLLCTLFGHKEVTESFTIIEHRVSATAPRCLESLQDITACTRCDTLLYTYVITSYYINCCP